MKNHRRNNRCGRHARSAEYDEPMSNVNYGRPRRRLQRRLPFLIVDVILRVIIMGLLGGAIAVLFGNTFPGGDFVAPKILIPISLVFTVIGLGYTCSFFPASRSNRKTPLDCLSIAQEVITAICIGFALGYSLGVQPSARDNIINSMQAASEQDLSTKVLGLLTTALVFQTVIFGWSCVSCCDSACQGERANGRRARCKKAQVHDGYVGRSPELDGADFIPSPASPSHVRTFAVDDHDQHNDAGELPTEPPPAYNEHGVPRKLSKVDQKRAY